MQFDSVFTILIIMKILITIIVLLLSFTVNSSEIYYCSDENVTGFEVKENHRIGNYEQESFKIEIDLENNMMLSEEIWMKNQRQCINDQYMETLYCISEFGAALSFYPKDKKYVLSQLFVNTNYDDSLLLSYGFCEKF